MQRSFPTLRAAARWLLLAAVSAAAGFALGQKIPSAPSSPRLAPEMDSLSFFVVANENNESYLREGI